MKFHLRIVFVAAAALANFVSGSHGAVVPVTAVSTHNNKDNFGGNKSDLINGSGMNGVNHPDNQVSWPTSDPATWTATSNQYRDEWQSGDLLDADEDNGGVPITNGKIGWAVFDLGSSMADLDKLYIWHVRENSGRYPTDFNVYVADAPTVAIPSSPTGNSSVDYDFASGGWTSVAAGLSGTYQGSQIVSLGGVTARYVAIEMIANNGDANRVGFAEVGITTTATGGGAELGIVAIDVDPVAETATLTIEGAAGTTYDIYGSTDLSFSDPPIGAATTDDNGDGTGDATFVDSAATAARKFYRAEDQ